MIKWLREEKKELSTKENPGEKVNRPLLILAFENKKSNFAKMKGQLICLFAAALQIATGSI